MARSKVKFVPERSGFAELLNGPKLAEFLLAEAERVAAAARASAPRATGDYADSIHVEEVKHPTRVVAQVVASDWKAHIIEANTGNLARALDAAG